MLMFTTIKYYTLTTFAVFYNLAPFCTVFLGYFLLKEKVNVLDMVTVVFGFAAVIFITYGMANSKQELAKGGFQLLPLFIPGNV